KEHLALAKRLMNGKERFDRVIVDKKIDSREQYMHALPKLCNLVVKSDGIVDAKYEKAQRSGLSKREHEKLHKDFKKSDLALQRLFDKFYFKQKVLEEFV